MLVGAWIVNALLADYKLSTNGKFVGIAFRIHDSRVWLMINLSRWFRLVFRLILAALYAFVGFTHLQKPAMFLQITPDWVPFPLQVVLATGICEIIGAIALCTPKFRRAAGWALALYAVCVFPANVKHALDDFAAHGDHMNWWYHGPRFLFQPVFVWWALWAGDVTDWPFARRFKKLHV